MPDIETLTAGPTLSQQIRETLIERIVSGELQPGERLVETRLAARFGTSQAPVREALRELATIGMVEVRPRRGTFVGPFVQQTLKESYIVRAALEESATRLTMLAGTLPYAALHEDVAQMHAAADAQDARGIVDASVSFHRNIVAAAGNDLLLRTWEGLQIAARTEVTLLAVELDLAAVADDHLQLLEAMIAEDIETACQHAREHQWVFAELPHGR